MAKIFFGFFAGVNRICVLTLSTAYESHVYRDTDLKNIDAIPRLGKFLNSAGYNFRLKNGKFTALLVHFIVIGDQLEKVWHVLRRALFANTLYPIFLQIVDTRCAERRII